MWLIPAADARLRSFTKHVVITRESKGIGAAHGRGKYDSEVAN